MPYEKKYRNPRPKVAAIMEIEILETKLSTRGY